MAGLFLSRGTAWRTVSRRSREASRHLRETVARPFRKRRILYVRAAPMLRLMLFDSTRHKGRGLATNAETIERAHVSASDAWYPMEKRDRFIVAQLVSKDFKLKYRRSVLGVAWSVLNPLLMMAVMVVILTSGALR